MSTREKIIEAGHAVTKMRLGLAPVARELAYSTREVHRQLVTLRVFDSDKQKQDGWKLLAKLAEYEFPGVRRGAETQSAWKGNKRPVRPLEWHHTPRPEEMTAWEVKVRAHKGAGPVASLAERVERLEKAVAELREAVYNSGRTA